MLLGSYWYGYNGIAFYIILVTSKRSMLMLRYGYKFDGLSTIITVPRLLIALVFVLSLLLLIN